MMRPGQWEPLIDEASQRFDVPQDIILRVMGAESSGRRDAVSPKGAAGLMQLMAPTYQELARKHQLGPDRFDPRNNIFAGTAYLRENYDRFGGDWGKALAAYNAGPGRVESGRPLPAETQAYVPKVLAGFEQTQGADVAPGLIRPRPGQTTLGSASADRYRGPMFGAARPNQSLTGLLEVEDENNFYDGLGLLNNAGQTPSQPPRTDPAAMPGTTQTDRMDVSGRINELLQQYLQKPQQSASSPLQYALAGMSGAVQPLAGVHDRKVGIGEMLGALGGGLTRGNLAGEEAQRQQVGGELDKLLKVGAYGNQQQTAALNAANSIIDNRYKQALTTKALAPTSDADRYKVVGKYVFDTTTNQFKAAPDAGGGGLFEGNAADVQGVNALIKAGKLTPEQGALWLASKTATGPNGQVDVINPLALPGAGGPPSDRASPTDTAPNTAAPGQRPDQARLAGAAPPPAPSNPGVTTVRPGVPQPSNEQNLNAGFANRMNASGAIFDTLETQGYAVPSKYDATVGQLPGVGNYMTSDQYKSLDQAQREFINAQLRRESGAAISPSEFDNANKQYFPQPGDPPEIVAQKRRSRELAVRNMAQSAGPAKIDFTPKKVEDKPETPRVLRFDEKGNPIP